MIQFLKDNLDRQLQFLGLMVGFYALLILNGLIVDVLNFPIEFSGFATILQTWVIIKYIMKK